VLLQHFTFVIHRAANVVSLASDLHEYLVQVPALLSNAAHRYCFPLKDLARDDLGSGSFVVLMARPREIVRLLTSAIEALEAVILRHGNREPAGAG
jgi:hypothetical protein